MKKIIACLLCVVFVLAVSGCGDPKVIDGVEYETIGLFEEKSPDVHYEVSVGNVVWSILLVESVIPTVYFVGWSIQNPMCKKSDYVPGVGCKR